MDTILKMKNIRKEFPGVVALDKVNLELKKGEVLALLGENGAGKSTLMKILSGTYHPDKGEIFLKGNRVDIKDAIHAKELGIGMIHQELSLSPNLSVAENIFALEEPTKFGIINDKKMIEETKKLLDNLGVDLDPTDIVSDLSISQQQMVEIAKALSTTPDILIMDEPTSALSNRETDKLFEIIDKLLKEDISIIYISHRMEELFKITDHVTVLRDGVYIDTVKTEEVTVDELIKMMVGRSMDNIYPDKDFKYVTDEKLLEVKNYNKKNFYRDINFFVRPGEIVGLYGLMGAGRTEIAQGIFGILQKDSGEMFINNEKVNINSPSKALENKIAFVTEDRKREGLILSTDVKENIIMANIDKILNKFKFIDYKEEINTANKHVENLRIKTPHIYQTVNNLSGGNQQKIVLSKWFEIEPKILILDEPTRGIDVGSKYEIYELMIELARSGVGIILISSELPEILNISDRLLVVNNNTIVEELNPKETTQEEIMGIITKGVKNQNES
ncbi:sugar ABC transporter ATP-binding protein [Clostridium sp. D2Q-11]|uniref:Sugar ABC transporter ATP-binding protein n=1 Tax=Anaeromonas frigoriresistens TaxID=2683708 RepID=A0A942Z8F1_9FIRM|nr:sugar ABC transporter ATP-binding protein [Anaeromonas frigoriresistens]MBS4537860.1 sugar ABC transporter ATP-binding protein [Anaeromonas frigoriresistens]